MHGLKIDECRHDTMPYQNSNIRKARAVGLDATRATPKVDRQFR